MINISAQELFANKDSFFCEQEEIEDGEIQKYQELLPGTAIFLRAARVYGIYINFNNKLELIADLSGVTDFVEIDADTILQY